MNIHEPVIPLQWHPLGFIEAFTQLGAPLAGLLRDTGITPQQLERRDERISYAQQQRLIDNGIALCQMPGIGLRVGQHFDWAYHGTVGAAVHLSPSLQAATEAFVRYLMILQPAYSQRARPTQFYFDEHSGLIVYPLHCFSSPDDNPARQRFELEFRLVITLRAWDACGNKSVPDPAVHVCLEYPEPAYADLYRSLPCTTLRFGCRQSCVAARPDFVTQPFRLLRKPLFDRLLEQCETELRKATAHSDYRTKVRWYLHAHLSKPAFGQAGFGKEVTLSEVAQFLSMTPRTLTRRLAEEGTSFRQLAHQVRMELAAHHLRCSNLSVDKVAELIGFSSASSLHRAIRNWRNYHPSRASTRHASHDGVLRAAASVAGHA